MSIEDDPGHAAYLAAIATLETPPLSQEPSAEAPAVVLDAEAGGSPSLPVVLAAEDVHMMMRQLRDCRSRIAEEIATCDADRAKLQHDLMLVDEHQERVTKEDRERAAFLEGQLTAHLLNLRAMDDRVKSIKTPWGDVTSRVQQPEIQRVEVVLIEWARGQGFTRTKTLTTLDWEGIKNACHVRGNSLVLTHTGEVVPGVEVVERLPKVTVEVFD
jgi:hypothetical protein